MKKYTLLILLIGLTATFANAQFPIKIPKIRIPKVEQPQPQNTPQPKSQPQPTNQPTSTRQAPVVPKSQIDVNQGASMAGEVRIIDSKTNFRLEEERVNYKVVGWMMTSSFWLIGDIPKRSALKFFVKKNGKELARYRCEIRDNIAFRCVDKTQVIKEIGLVDVEVNFINGSTDEEKPLRKYKIDVHRTEKFNDYANFFVNRHPDVAVGFLSIEGVNWWVLNASGQILVNSSNKFQLTFNTMMSRNYEGKSTGEAFIRCSLNGQPFKLKNSRIIIGPEGGGFVAVYESKHLTGTRKGSIYKDYLQFEFERITLPLALGTESPFMHDISNMPGNWECKIIRDSDREIIRTFRFTLDANGEIVTHPEQQNGTVVFAPWEYMIDMDIPSSGSPIDYRLKPFPKLGFFHGIPWTTAEGKALAEKVPNKGNPFPLPAK